MASFTITPLSPVLSRPFEVRIALERLANKFHVPAPNIRFSHGRKKGVYLKHEDTILIGPNAWNGLTNTFLHCMSHAIVHKVSTDQEFHGIRFLDTLWQVVLAHYGNPEQYSWYADHSVVFEYGRNKIRSQKMEWE